MNVHAYEGLRGFGVCAKCIGRDGTAEGASDRTAPQHMAVHLINVGDYPAKFAHALEPGDVLVYNYGSTATVIAVEPAGQSLWVTVRDERGGEYRTRKRRSTLVPFSEHLTDRRKATPNTEEQTSA